MATKRVSPSRKPRRTARRSRNPHSPAAQVTAYVQRIIDAGLGLAFESAVRGLAALDSDATLGNVVDAYFDAVERRLNEQRASWAVTKRAQARAGVQ